jgi:small-conductance mechanosensitive channel
MCGASPQGAGSTPLLCRFRRMWTPGRSVASVPPTLLHFVKLVRQAVMLVGLVVALSALEINTGPPLALIGGAAFVVGLSLQSTLADSSVNFVVRPWTKTADYWTVYWDVTREVKRQFDAARFDRFAKEP